MAVSVPLFGTRALWKCRDADMAQRLGRATETIRSYRTGKRVPPPHLHARMLVVRAEDAIAEARQELHRIESEARLANLALPPRIRGVLAALTLGGDLCAPMCEPGRGADTARDDEAAQ